MNDDFVIFNHPLDTSLHFDMRATKIDTYGLTDPEQIKVWDILQENRRDYYFNVYDDFIDSLRYLGLALTDEHSRTLLPGDTLTVSHPCGKIIYRETVQKRIIK